MSFVGHLAAGPLSGREVTVTGEGVVAFMSAEGPAYAFSLVSRPVKDEVGVSYPVEV